VLALALGGRTIAEWQASMSQLEFIRWIEFWRRWPFDDVHRYQRPALLIAQALGADGNAAADWLSPPDIPEGWTAADIATMRAFGADLTER